MKRLLTPGYVLYVAMLLAGAAGAYHLLAPRFRPLTVEDMARPDYRDSPERLMRKIDRDGLLHDLRPHAKATHDGISYATNNDGLREDHDYALEKSLGVRRVVLLGDSFVFGWGLRLEHTMSHQLASLLDPTKWEVLNLGVPAYNTYNEVTFLAERGLKYHPDVVVLMYHPNDAAIGGPTELGDAATTEQMLGDYYDGKSAPEQRAQVEAYLRSQGQPLAPAWNAPELASRDRLYFAHHFLPLYWSQVQAAFDRLATLAKEHHFRVLVAIIPELDRPWEKHPFAPIYERVREEVARQGFEAIDLYPLLQHYPNPDLMLWGHDGHTSAFADRIIALTLAERLQGGG